ncbi:protein Fe65 homolog isoform X2 [Mytilus californianus]|uniref:protein Fe65 homolog isoform X2 n=1 Tax=Mytilus californianus TaxID=6549 RepID=UPI00224634E5|nr:protein Fe65 homolog isoform X2 [Mytilus californianus]
MLRDYNLRKQHNINELCHYNWIKRSFDPNMVCSHRKRTRKFNFNIYGTLYRRLNRFEKTWTFHHNPLPDVENTYLSFANPNYHYEDRKNSNDKLNKDVYHNDNNIYDEVDVSTISLLDKQNGQETKDMKVENKELDKLSQKKRHLLNDVNSSDDEVATSTDEEIENKDRGKNEKVLSENKKNLKNSDSGFEELDNSKTSRNRKKQGFMGYYTMLEAKAKEKQLKILETPDTEEDTPTGGSKFTKFGFDINSPDSNDSGIQSDARSDDGSSHVHGPVNDDIYAVVCKSTSSDLGLLRIENSGSEDNTPTEEDNPKKQKEERLPPGWEKCEDEDGAYYWHIKSGTIQREPPSPAPPDTKHVTIRSVSINSDSSTLSSDTESDSVPSTPTSGTSEDPLTAFEGHALQYAVNSIQNMSSSRSLSAVPKVEANGPEKKEEKKAVRFSVRSLGWVRIAEEDLTPERSSRAVNKCIVDLTLGRNDINDVVGRWGDGKDLYLDLDRDSLRLVDTQDFIVINVQPIQSIRVWGVGRDNGRDFAYVARDKTTRKHMCHVFRCDNPARQIANTLRDICKQLMMERRLQQAAVEQRLSRPTDLPNLEIAGQQGNQKAVLQSLLRSASFPTPMEEPKKVIRCHYIGCEAVLKPVGTDILNGAIMALYNKIPPEKWKFVNVGIAPSTITITEHKTEVKLDECRVRFLSFMGIAVDNVRLCGFIIHGPEDQFNCHVFHCEPSAGALCKTIEAACKLRYQKLLDANPTTPTNSNKTDNKSFGACFRHGVQSMIESMKSPVK